MVLCDGANVVRLLNIFNARTVMPFGRNTKMILRPTGLINTKKGINATMAKRKFKNQLVEQMKQEEREKEHQESLKERYDIEEDVVVVEKNNTIKFLLKTMIGGARLIIAILVFILALIGLTALIYPDSRSLLIRQGLQVWQEFMRLL